MAILFCHLFFCIKKSELVAFFCGGYFPTAPSVLIHVPRIPPPLNYLARINESEGGGMNRFMSVYNTFVGV